MALGGAGSARFWLVADSQGHLHTFLPSTLSGDEQCVFLMLFLQVNQGLLLAWQMQCIGLLGAHIPACLRVSACAFLSARPESGEEESRRRETSRSTLSQDKENLLLFLFRDSIFPLDNRFLYKYFQIWVYLVAVKLY